MKFTFLAADKEREHRLAEAFIEGLGQQGDEGEIVFKSKDVDWDASDAFGMVGVKSLKLFQQARSAGKQVVYFDKGYFRHRGPNRTWEYWRVAVNDHHPTDYVARAKHGPARWERLSRRRVEGFKSWRDPQSPGPVIYAGSSEKYHAFAGLPEPTEYAAQIVKDIKRRSNRLVVYRPKPTWMDAEPVRGASFSGREDNLGDLLRGAWCLVTNGSNAGFDAVLAGVPCIVLGNGIARPISSTSLDDIEKPYEATESERLQWLSNISWCMFTEEEMCQGLAWAAIRPQFDGGILDDSLIKNVACGRMKPTKALLKRYGEWRKEKKKVAKKSKGKNGAIRI